jgi:hypothetical protein
MSTRDLANSIRPLIEAARASRQRPVLAIDGRIVRTVATREHVGRRIDERLRALAIFVPDLRIANVLFDGSWMWSLRGHVPSRSPRPRRPVSFCRVDFSLRIDSVHERLALECRSTVHDADLPALQWESGFDTTDWEEFSRWIEKAVLAFAAAYFGGRASS